MSNKDVYVSGHGVKTTAHWDDEGVTIAHEQRVDPIIDTFRDLSDRGHNRKAVGQLSASVPISIHNKWVKEWRDNYSDKYELKVYLAMKINSTEGAPFRNQKIRG